MSSIVKLSRALKWTALAAMVFLPLLNVLYWATDGLFGHSLFDLSPIPNIPHLQPLSALQTWQKVVGCLVSMVPTGLSVLALLWLHRLFSCYERLEIFSTGAVRNIRNFALTLISIQLLHPFYCASISPVLTLTNEPGKRMIIAELGPAHIALIAVALAVWLIAWVMDEGRKLQQECEGTI